VNLCRKAKALLHPAAGCSEKRDTKQRDAVKKEDTKQRDAVKERCKKEEERSSSS
jgi:hypothetical protein